MNLIDKIRHKRRVLGTSDKGREPVKVYNSKERVANAFNTLYQAEFNGTKRPSTIEKEQARQLVETFYSQVDIVVFEYLSMYLCNCQNGKIEFIPSQEACVDLVCKDNAGSELVSFESNGRISKREKMVASQPEK